MFGLSEKVYNEIMDVIKKFPNYRFIMFGSRARGDYKNNSDIDLAIFENVNSGDEYKIRNEIDLLDIAYGIDLVFVDKKTKKELLENIQKEGVDLN